MRVDMGKIIDDGNKTMTFNVSGKLELDDYRRFNRTFLKNQIFSGKKKYIYIVIAFWMVVIWVSDFVRSVLDGKNPFTVGIIAFIVFVFTIYYLIYTAYFSKRSLSRYFNSNTMLSEPQKIFIDKDMIEIKAESFTTKLTASTVHRVLSDDSAVYVFISMRQAYLVPSKYFSDENEFACCRDFIIEKFGGK